MPLVSRPRPVSRSPQRGISFLGIVFWLLVLGFFAMIGLTLLPIYLNQMKVKTAVAEAAKAAQGPDDVAAVKRALDRIWGVDDIQHLDYKDVVISRNGQGKGLMLSYDYEVREHMVANVDIVVHFKNSVPAGPGAAS